MDEKINCGICASDRDVKPVAKWLVGVEHCLMCYHCFCAWYDYGLVEVQQIREKSFELRNGYESWLLKARRLEAETKAE
jgi:hypothetical protein